MKMKTFLLAGVILSAMACTQTKKIADPARLNETWELQRIGNNIISTEEHVGKLPTLELQLAEGRAFGHGGCNRFTGSFKLEDSKIVFSMLASTKMACLNPNVENQYLGLLSGKTHTYKLSEGTLYLGEGENMLVFKKTE